MHRVHPLSDCGLAWIPGIVQKKGDGKLHGLEVAHIDQPDRILLKHVFGSEEMVVVLGESVGFVAYVLQEFSGR